MPAGAHRAQHGEICVLHAAFLTAAQDNRGSMPTVPGYTHLPGHHCGSTALRNLLCFHGVEISEEMAFGLGAGACFYYVDLEDASPSRWFNGRTARLEENFDELTGAALELRTFEQGDWRRLGGGTRGRRRGPARPPAHRSLLPRPLRQLGALPRPRRGPRRLRRGGRPALGHRVRGAADDPAGEPRPGPPQQPPGLSARRPHVHRRRHRASRPRACAAAVPAAIERAARAMVEPEVREFSGLDAVRRLAEEAGSWPEVAADWQLVRPLRLPGDRAARDRAAAPSG